MSRPHSGSSDITGLSGPHCNRCRLEATAVGPQADCHPAVHSVDLARQGLDPNRMGGLASRLKHIDVMRLGPVVVLSCRCWEPEPPAHLDADSVRREPSTELWGQPFPGVTGGALELAFSTQELRSLCEAEAAAARHLGADGGAALKKRLADFRAASSVAELLELVGCHAKSVRGKDRLAIGLGGDNVIVFCPNHVQTPRSASGSVDWTKVSRIKILRIGGLDA